MGCNIRAGVLCVTGKTEYYLENKKYKYGKVSTFKEKNLFLFKIIIIFSAVVSNFMTFSKTEKKDHLFIQY